MAAVLPLLLLFLPLLLQPLASAEETPSEVKALLRLKAGFADNSSSLSSWTGRTPPCKANNSWAGVYCTNGHVAALRLSGMQLSGTVDVDALKSLGGLRALSLADNSFSGPIPDLSGLQGLKALHLSRNGFSGNIPAKLFDDMNHLKKLWLAGNGFTGPIPSSIARAATLVELRLENNMFSGLIPELDSARGLKSFSVANNTLEGPIPDSLTRFEIPTFLGNEKLCGPPLQPDPCEWPGVPPAPTPPGAPSSKKAAISVLLLLAVSLLVILAAMYVKRRRELGFRVLSRDNGDFEERTGSSPLQNEGNNVSLSHGRRNQQQQQQQQQQYDQEPRNMVAGPSGGGGGGGAGELVMVNERKAGFGLSDLMKAAAEVLGSGGLGSAYRAVMADGAAVVVKRLRDMNRVGREGFDAELRRLGQMQHPNVLPPLAYHYRKDEKLLVYEFVPKGSLLYILHGDRGADHAALNWPTRLKILRGIARGMAHLHAELASHEAPHGNLKSGNVLLASDFEPLLVDYGFVTLVNPAQATQCLFSSRSPEALLHRQVSPKSDVYCFGIVILEVLTGKFPSQYLNNTKGGTDVVRWATTAIDDGRDLAELLDPAISATKSAVPAMERLLRIGAACAEPDPEQRPSMSEAAAHVEEIAAEADRARSFKDRSTGLGGSNKHAAYVRDGVGELSARRLGSIGERSARRFDDSIAFAIS